MDKEYILRENGKGRRNFGNLCQNYSIDKIMSGLTKEEISNKKKGRKNKNFGSISSLLAEIIDEDKSHKHKFP